MRLTPPLVFPFYLLRLLVFRCAHSLPRVSAATPFSRPARRNTKAHVLRRVSLALAPAVPCRLVSFQDQALSGGLPLHPASREARPLRQHRPTPRRKHPRRNRPRRPRRRSTRPVTGASRRRTSGGGGRCGRRQQRDGSNNRHRSVCFVERSGTYREVVRRKRR